MVNSNPAISVILPVFNAAETLDEAVESMVNQSCPDFELIIVDDGSTDGSTSLINRWKNRDDRVKTIRTNHNGIVHALNRGLELASGSLVARMDADDRSMPERLERQKKYLDTHPETGLVSCLVEHLGDEEASGGYARYVNWINSLVQHREISINRFIESPLAHPSVMFRAELIDKYGGYRDENVPEDYELWLRWLEKGVIMEKVPAVLLQWRDEPNRLSRNHPRYSFEAFYRVKARYLSNWLKRHNPHHPEIIVWGAGRTTRKRAEMLVSHGITITHYIDIDPNKIGHTVHGRPVLGPRQIPDPGDHFIVPYVARHGANKMIREELEKQGYKRETHFIFAA